MVKVATPLTAVTVVVHVTPDAVEVIVTDAVEVEMRLPLASCTCTTAPKGVPAVPVDGGLVEKTSLVAAAALMVMLELVALVRPVDAAVRV